MIKKVNFFEAMAALKNGKLVTSCQGWTYELVGDRIQFHGSDDVAEFDQKEINGSWTIHEEEPELKKLWQWAVKYPGENWYISDDLLSHSEVSSGVFECYQKHDGPFIEKDGKLVRCEDGSL